MRILKDGEKEFDLYLSEVERRIEEYPTLLENEVRSILKEVRKRGDDAILHYTKLFDGLELKPSQIKVREEEIKDARKRIPQGLFNTLKRAAYRIRKFQSLSKKRFSLRWVEKGIHIEQILRPLDRVGIYIPGGKASYPSTLLMAAIPAKVAGVREIILTTPPHKEGISPAILASADIAGVNKIYQVGGAQAIGAMAYGTSSIPKVDKIVGPGNRYVAVAKRLVYGLVDIDMIAGPSEIVIISDGNTSPSFIAADLISQAEHDEAAMAILITTSDSHAIKVKDELVRQLSILKRRKIAWRSLKQRGAILVVKDIDHAIELANRISPEHLELSVRNPLKLVGRIKNAGAIFLGSNTPEAIGDYMAGPNHILPTGGTARFSSSLGVMDFLKRINLIGFTQNSLKRFEDDIKRFTDWEGLEGHYRSVRIRMGGI